MIYNHLVYKPVKGRISFKADLSGNPTLQRATARLARPIPPSYIGLNAIFWHCTEGDGGAGLLRKKGSEYRPPSGGQTWQRLLASISAQPIRASRSWRGRLPKSSRTPKAHGLRRLSSPSPATASA